MHHYKTILFATDLSDEAKTIAKKAVALRDNNIQKPATLHIIHVIEPLDFAYGGDIPMDFSDIQGNIQRQTEKKLAAFSAKLAIKPEHQYIITGRPEVEVHKQAEVIKADLIVIGSHGRHGLSLLLGSTVNGVLHGASCDVLAVRVGEKNT